MKLCLGTVQFGQDYGIIGQKKPDLNYSVNCLDYATQNGIDAIDTAEAYGTAQEVVGAFLKKRTIQRDKLSISTKLLPNSLDNINIDEYYKTIKEHLIQTLKVLHTDYVDSYVFHSSRYVFNHDMIDALHKMVDEGLAKTVGVSVYDPKEAVECLNNPAIQFTQFPYSIFDRRMKDAGIFDLAKNKSCNIDTRSAFIKGLILLDENQVPDYLKDAKPLITKLKKISSETNISRVALALAYVKRESTISHLVFGVDSKEQLMEDIELFNTDISDDILEKLDNEFSKIEEHIIIPSLWKKD